jgi:hypothetical protein
MPREFDLEDDEERFHRAEDDDSGVTCRRCGAAGLQWVSVTNPNGMGESRRLVNARMAKHVCPAKADDFGVVEG